LAFILFLKMFGREKIKRKRLKVFLGFLIFGITLNLTQNLIVIKLVTEHPINLRAILISLIVMIPFAAISELIVDRTTLLPRYKKWRKRSKLMKNLETFLEFVIFGVFISIIDDLIIITILTGKFINLETLGIIFLIVIPFAIVSELVVDRKDWFPRFFKTKSVKEP